jgi:hypothetical protein
LEFTKLAKVTKTKGNKIFHIMKIQWISTLNPAKRIMAEFITLLLKMVMENNINQQTKLNFKHLYDL